MRALLTLCVSLVLLTTNLALLQEAPIPEEPTIQATRIVATPIPTPTPTPAPTPTAPPPAPSAQPLAPVAQNASWTVWDSLAECECNGNWACNTGNGYYGGLQWLPSTWRDAGGTKYADLPHRATREQEIEIAQSWLAKTSWKQWPACSLELGLR